MKVSDKDFDQLFSSKLGELEMEPSANVWGNIAGELDGKKEEKREVKGGLPFMKIAAGIVLFMAVGLYFIRPEHTVISLHARVEPVNVIQDDRAITPAPSVDYTESPVVADAQPTATTRQQSKPVVNRVESAVAKKIDTAQNTTQYVAAVDQQPDNNVRIAQAATIQLQKQGLVPETIISNPVKSTSILQAKNTAPVIANVPNTKTEPVKKHRIHSLGDLLNVVIAKVDKRDDKLIEFTNTNDEDSFNVTGVNLGLLKAKKDK